MRRTTPALIALALLPVLATALALSSPTTLHIHANETPDTTAGTTLQHAISITLEGPTDPTPGAATRVNLILDAPPDANCQLPNTTQLDPATGTATETLTCTPTHTGDHPLHITAESPPHEPATWNTTLTTTPDTLNGTLTTHEPRGYQIPLTLNLTPTHLETTDATLTLQGHLHGSPQSFHHAQPITLHKGWTQTTNQLALYGPGTYTLTANITGENIHPLNLTDTATVTTTAQPTPRNATTQFNVTVYEGPTIRFNNSGQDREDSVNRDDVNKNPGQDIITRIHTDNTDTVNITVYRTVQDEAFILEQSEHEVGPNGDLEHRFEHDPLPAQRIHITASAGNATLTRTAQIDDLRTKATIQTSPTTIADGRPVHGTLTLHDRNHGSTPQDPGPIWSLPNTTYKVYNGSHSSRTADGWNLSIGDDRKGPEGDLPTSQIPWPNGTSWATSQPGKAEIPTILDPPPNVEPRTYRLTVLEADGARLDTWYFDLVPAPITLEAPDLKPGETLPVSVNLTQQEPKMTAAIEFTIQDETVATHTVTQNTTLNMDIPTLPPGATVHMTATADWPGRPPPDLPDAQRTLEMPPVPPRLGVFLDHDGDPAGLPLAVLPGDEHVLTPLVNAQDPHGGDVIVDITFLDPSGERTGWTENATGSTHERVTIPKDASRGRYNLLVQASSDHATTTQNGYVDVDKIVRLSLSEPKDLRVTAGEETSSTYTITNDGTAPVERIVLQLDSTEGISVEAGRGGEPVPAGESTPWALEPGEASEFEVRVTATEDARGHHEVGVKVAGVSS